MYVNAGNMVVRVLKNKERREASKHLVKAREEEVAVRMAVRDSLVPDDPLHSSIVKDDESSSFSLPSGCIEVATQVINRLRVTMWRERNQAL